MTLTIRQATQSDQRTVEDLWNEAAAWLREQGQDQWQYPIKVENIRDAIANRTCWLVEDSEPIATVTLDENADPQLWTPADHPDQALYAHRLVVRHDARAQELGSTILDWASSHAAECGKRWLRLDAWSSNQRLHRYYLDRGFRLVRIVNDPKIISGVLFERSVDRILRRGPSLSDAAVRTIADLATDMGPAPREYRPHP